ncbi:fibrobacter succinogenes major paralogous domain-containing protein, partial [Balneolaceae bacterium ANBcel3]|nr:fibrobacter succinogenes major paralogous domain-containing protein [Balneolaceae bacterium ANBcel3]
MSHQKGTTTFLIALAFLLTQCDVSSSGGGFPDDDQGKDQETGTVTDIDGNEYKTIVIGEQEWMAENLRVTHFRDGTEIPSGLNHSEWKNTTEGAYAVYVHRKESHAKSKSSDRNAPSPLTENDSATVVNKIDRTAGTGDVYGLLYNWYAIHDSPGLCPAGWHVASDENFKELEKQWGMPDAEINTSQWRGGDQNVGGKMKATGTAYWNIPNVGATNESGFEGLPGGFRDHEGLFGKRGETGFWWTATEADRNLATERRLAFDDGSVYRGVSPKNNGFSVRCVRTGDGSHDDDKDDNGQNDDQDDEHEYGSVTDIDGNTYKTVVIGEQEWMAQNLRTTRYNNGNDLLTGFSNSEWETLIEGAYAIYDHQAENTAGINSPEEMAEIYGLLYNRYAIEQNNLCPVNWEVPSRDDWQELVDHLINEYQYSNSRSDPESVGQALKIARQVQHPLGNSYATEEHPRWDFSSTFYGLDRFGFSALPAGMRSSTGNFISIGVYAHWWSATDEPLTPTSSPQTSLWYGHNYMVYGSVINDRSGLSVRCIRVDSQDEGDKADLPELQTAPVSDITSTSAISGGEVTHDGGAIVTDRGVVWSTSQNPTLQRNQGMTTDGSGTGHFTSTLKNLSPETRYYVRAYATNSEGTSYGD